MKKLNFNNNVSGDDDKLLSILKESVGREPTEQFVENTLEKILIINAIRKKVYKPLKSPLYMMLVMVVILLVPVFITLSSEISIPDPSLELGNLIENMSFQLESWYTLSIILLGMVLMTLVWLELGLVKFRNPFI